MTDLVVLSSMELGIVLMDQIKSALAKVTDSVGKTIKVSLDLTENCWKVVGLIRNLIG